MAKKSKVVKKALAKKATPKKAAAKPVAPKAKKAPVKSGSPKGRKAASKKVVAKKAIAKKIVKKAPVKKAAPQKVVIKKPVARKNIAIKKPVAVKTTPAKVAVKTTLPARKKNVAKKQIVPAALIQLPDATVENAANINQQMMVPGDGLSTARVISEDPVKTFDKNVFNKATSKGDPHSNRHLSSKPKNTIKPSGKKPLW